MSPRMMAAALAMGAWATVGLARESGRPNEGGHANRLNRRSRRAVQDASPARFSRSNAGAGPLYVCLCLD